MPAQISALNVVALVTILVMLPVGAARAEPPKATPADRAVIEACLALTRANAERQAQQSSLADETPTPQGRLEAAARDAALDPASCIGAVSIPCQQQPGGSTTAGMIACTDREWAVWDERLNTAYRDGLAGASRKIAAALRRTQRAWLAWRQARCALPALENEGGSIVGPLYAACMAELTARQAIWLASTRE